MEIAWTNPVVGLYPGAEEERLLEEERNWPSAQMLERLSLVTNFDGGGK